MELKLRSRLTLVLSLIWIAIILILVSWWGYLLVDLGEKLALQGQGQDRYVMRISNMITWEGGTLIVLLILVSIGILTQYEREIKTARSVRAFFSSLTHELKTPLASIRLQSEVLDEFITSKEIKQEKIKELVTRLIEDCTKLENSMDKILQLARLSKKGPQNLHSIDIKSFIKNCHKNWGVNTTLELDLEQEVNVLADSFFLELIFRNLFENSKTHSGPHAKIKISVQDFNQHIVLKYTDGGKFSGDLKKLGGLFYKFNSERGSGIGLYLSTQLIKSMKGKLNFSCNNGELVQTIELIKAHSEEA